MHFYSVANFHAQYFAVGKSNTDAELNRQPKSACIFKSISIQFCYPICIAVGIFESDSHDESDANWQSGFDAHTHNAYSRFIVSP
jgi:hypothetical protein